MQPPHINLLIDCACTQCTWMCYPNILQNALVVCQYSLTRSVVGKTVWAVSIPFQNGIGVCLHNCGSEQLPQEQCVCMVAAMCAQLHDVLLNSSHNVAHTCSGSCCPLLLVYTVLEMP